MISYDFNQIVGKKIPTKLWPEVLSRIQKVLKVRKDLEVSIAIVGDAAMKKLNKFYRGKNKVTDVLSFGEMDSSIKNHFLSKGYLGEVVICYPQAVRQAAKAKHSLEREIRILFVHGVMHLLGYDHELDKEAELMEGLEKKILK